MSDRNVFNGGRSGKNRMTVSKGVGKLVVACLGILFVVIGVIVSVNVLAGGTPVRELISNSIKVRSAQNAIERAQAIAFMEKKVANSDNPDVIEQWNRITACLSSSCPDEAYFDLILVIASSYENDLENSALLINLIAVNRYWGSSEVLEFSKALSLANDQIDSVDNRRARRLWQDIVDCDGRCAEMNDLFFELISTIVEQSS